ncbi:hypothetical protein [Persicirhabdus sediminis]|uniref:Uncharacterized protein n=1 Tax=Persicirhabdus sediminis TaxID=454144 RepID=A0A8J7SHQ9_9BACT|nr:hypothetical protein [Persicirhabdus sediminis]MBK1790019.1 hypothetical protein [Persicirhabdus sediminis]
MERDFGDQPLDRMMQAWGMSNHDLVEVSTEQMTHKQVQKARKGRRLTLKMMQKVCRAFNVAIWYQLNDEEKEAYYEYMHRDLFSYAKGADENWVDPNTKLIEAFLERKADTDK